MTKRNREKNVKRRRVAEVLNDLRAHEEGYDRFSRSAVLDDGKAVKVVMRSGAQYILPTGLLMDIFEGYRRAPQAVSSPRRVVRTRRLKDERAVLVTLDNGERLTLPWDTVLMACEPRFEHFGGLTDKSRAITQKWWPSSDRP
jgi:hypothetical protein